MKILSAILAFFFLFPGAALSFTPQEHASSVAHCGAERIEVKSLADPNAGRVNMTPERTTVAALRAIPIPAGFSKYSEARYAPELHTYTVRAQIVGWKREADKDFHIVIEDPGTSLTMIVEPPDPSCPLMAKYGMDTRAVRSALVACFGEPPASYFKRFTSPVIADFTGVAFFDALHGASGAAPNGIELHPLLFVRILNGCSR